MAHRHNDQHERAHVGLVTFCAGPYHAALEASHVLAMSDRPSALRMTHADSLLGEKGEHSSTPSHWLTLRDTQSDAHCENTDDTLWQLGVSGDISLQQLPAHTLYPLPNLLLSRRFSAALCGVTFIQQQLVLLLDAQKLSLTLLDRQP